MLIPSSLALSLATATLSMNGPDATVLMDLDGDGVSESITISYVGTHAISVERDGKVLLLDAPSDIMGPRPELYVRPVDQSKTGVALLALDIPGGEYCGSGSTTYFVGLGEHGPTLALEGHNWSDSPVYSRVELAFSAESRTVTRTYTSSDGEEEYVDVAVLAFSNGVYQSASL